jgi:thiol-disulfide isomerase/thioredoxin
MTSLLPHALRHAFGAIVLSALAFSVSGFGADAGSTEAEVLEALGEPTSRMSAGSVTILNYPNRIFRLENGTVVSIRRLGGSGDPAPAASNGNAGGSGRTSSGTSKSLPSSSTKSTASAASKASSGPGAAAKRPTGPALEWGTEYRAAAERAASAKRPVFLFFTGSNWCTWCKKLETEILETTLFRNYAARKLVLVKLDFPRGIPQPEWMISQNQALSKKYRITGYPTVVMLSPTGKFLASLGYAPGGPVPFVAALQELESKP